MSFESPPKYILGYTSDETVLLDFDNTSLDTVKYWARRAMKRFDLGGFLVLESSPGARARRINIVLNNDMVYSCII